MLRFVAAIGFLLPVVALGAVAAHEDDAPDVGLHISESVQSGYAEQKRQVAQRAGSENPDPTTGPRDVVVVRLPSGDMVLRWNDPAHNEFRVQIIDARSGGDVSIIAGEFDVVGHELRLPEETIASCSEAREFNYNVIAQDRERGYPRITVFGTAAGFACSDSPVVGVPNAGTSGHGADFPNVVTLWLLAVGVAVACVGATRLRFPIVRR